jgi:predicted deacylase
LDQFVPYGDALTIDWISAEAIEQPAQRLIITTGQHGVEAFVGVAMLHLFVDDYLSQLDPRRTGLLLVHAINPWGMQHRRRVNRANVDLNRNFVWTPDELDATINADYAWLTGLLNPVSPITNLAWSKTAFLWRVARSLLTSGASRLRAATLLGQYRYPRGIYYGGDTLQPETQRLIALYREHFRTYEHIVHLDMHTGYGPRDQMSLVNSPLEPRDSIELQRAFDYPLVVKADPAEFYAMRGDMIDYVYRLARAEFPDQHLYAAAFEFGTLGDSTLAGLRSLRALILENQLQQYGTRDAHSRVAIQHDFNDLFAPTSADWQGKALGDARRAFCGILQSEGVMRG